MTEHTATFEIEDASDARAASRALEELANRFREEELAARDADTERETLASFERLVESVGEEERGHVEVTYRSRS